MVEFLHKFRGFPVVAMLCHDLAELATVGCLHLFILHRLEAISLVPQLIMPIYDFFLHACLFRSVNNK